jgi:hypothetical protein
MFPEQNACKTNVSKTLKPASGNMNETIRGLGSKVAYSEFQLKRIAESISRLVVINKI